MLFKNRAKSLEEQVLIEIDTLFKEGLYPSMGKIAKGIGKEKSLRSVQFAIEKLEIKGYIKRDSEQKIEFITDAGKTFLEGEISLKNTFSSFQIPIIGSIACGGPSLAYENIQGYLDISSDIVKSYNKDDYFILISDGDSMDLDGIEKGDMLLIKKQNYAKNGDRIVALISNEDATLKEYQESSKGYIKLIPHSSNEKHKPLIVERNNILVQGIFLRNLGRF